jgi:hypothetical protein
VFFAPIRCRFGATERQTSGERVMREDPRVVDFEYVRSRGAHGIHAHGSFDAFLGSDRAIWLGSDGSGMIRESRGPVDFFTEAGRERWQEAGSPTLEHGPTSERYAPGQLGRSGMTRARLESDPDAMSAALRRHAITLHQVQELLGESVVSVDFCRATYQIVRRMADVEVISELSDHPGRVGTGLAGVQNGERIELVFARDCSELMGYQWFLAEPQPFAPEGTLHSWSAFLERATSTCCR